MFTDKNNLPFPDRSDAIDFHVSKLQEAFACKDFEKVNFYYPKLIESIRQQNINYNGIYDSHLQKMIYDYEEFRRRFGYECPKEYLHNFNKIKEETSSKKINYLELVGFYGTKQYSNNQDYCIVSRDGRLDKNKWIEGDIALVFKQILLFKKKIQRPNNCCVSNNGIVACCDWLNSDELEGDFLIYDNYGVQILHVKTSANLGNCAISDNGEVAIFETHFSKSDDSNKIFIIDIRNGKILNEFIKPFYFDRAIIDTDSKRIKFIGHKNYNFEIDFDGNQTNLVEYEAQIMNSESILDKLNLLSSKPESEKFQDKRYLDLLKEALNDNETSYSYGQDKIFRMIGEFYYANNDIKQTIENWEKAIEINPKIGILKKLENLKNKK